MKICVIGNSHLAAFKLAWDDLADTYHNKAEMIFFGSPGKSLEVAIESGYLVPTTEKVKKDFHNTSGGLTKIDFADFDAVLLVGLGCSIWCLSEAFGTHRVYDAPFSIKDTTYKTISAACIAQICVDQMKNTAMFQIASLIRSTSKIPIFIIPTPFYSETCKNNWKESFLALNACRTVQTSYHTAISQLCQSFVATFIPQPDSTITDFLFTKENLSKGSVYLDRSLKRLHRETDYTHMNQEYGKEVLTFALQKYIKTV